MPLSESAKVNFKFPTEGGEQTTGYKKRGLPPSDDSARKSKAATTTKTTPKTARNSMTPEAFEHALKNEILLHLDAAWKAHHQLAELATQLSDNNSDQAPTLPEQQQQQPPSTRAKSSQQLMPPPEAAVQKRPRLGSTEAAAAQPLRKDSAQSKAKPLSQSNVATKPVTGRASNQTTTQAAAIRPQNDTDPRTLNNHNPRL